MGNIVTLRTQASAQAAQGTDGPYPIEGGAIVNPGGQCLPNTDKRSRNNRFVAIRAGVTAGPAGTAKVIGSTGHCVSPGMIKANTGTGPQEPGGVQTMNHWSERA